MKKILALVSLLFVLTFGTASAVSGGSLYGWTVVKQVQTAYDCANTMNGCWSAIGYGSGGTIYQDVPITQGDYFWSVWCAGNGTFFLQQGAYSQVLTCDGSNWDWPVMKNYWHPLQTGIVRIGATLGAGDRGDAFCLTNVHTAPNGCPPYSQVINFSFESSRKAK